MTTRGRPASNEVIPEATHTFLVRLQTCLARRKISEIGQLYEVEFAALTDRFYKASPWPRVSSVAALLNIEEEEDSIFLYLYKELYFRHLYQKCSPTSNTPQMHYESFDNYIALFDRLLALDLENPDVDLPSVWTWDLTDEFIYQFQAFHSFRNQQGLSSEVIAELKSREDAWSARTVMQYLRRFIKWGGLNLRGDTQPVQSSDRDTNVHPLVSTLAHFSCIALLRVNCVLGDFHGALSALTPIELRDKRNPFRRVLAAQSALYFYLCFALMMTRRYVDAVKALSGFLSFFSRAVHRQPSGTTTTSLTRRADKMTAMLAVVSSLVPCRLDDSRNVIKEKYADRLPRLQAYDVRAFEELFVQCCPKFVSPRMPLFDEPDSSVNPYRGIATRFVSQIEAQPRELPDVMAYLRLCTTISMAKLQSFVKAESKEALISLLLCLKRQWYQRRWVTGSVLSGEWTTASDYDFHVDKDVIHLEEFKAVPDYSQYFMRQILKCEELIHDVERGRRLD